MDNQKSAGRLLHNTIIDTNRKQVTDIPIGENQMESTRMGTPPFPLAVFHDDLKENLLGYVNWHWNKELQFCRVVEGTVLFYVGGRVCEVPSGNGIFINAGVLHMAKSAPGSNGVYICVMADADLLRGFINSVFDTKYVTPFLSSPAFNSAVLDMDVPWQARSLQLISDISNLQYKEKYGYELDILASLVQVWALLLRNLRPDVTVSKNRTRSETAVNAILSYIGDHYTERIRIEEIANAVSYSPGECCRIFKKVLGITISRFLNTYRVEKSTELLSGTDMSISDIAYGTGFGSTSYYIRHFRILTGITPLQYRKTHTSGRSR